MDSWLFGFGTPSTTGTQYTAINTTSSLGFRNSESNVLTVMPVAATLSKFSISLSAAPGVGNSYTFTIRKSGGNTSLTITISGTATTGSDTVDSASFSPGDTVSISCVPSGTPASAVVTFSTFCTTSAGFPVLQHSNAALSTTATQYTSAMGGNGSSATVSTEAAAAMIVPVAGVLSNLYAVLSASPGTSKSYAVTVMHNGVATTLTTGAISGSNTTGNDTTHSINVAAGDTISIQTTPSGTPTSALFETGMLFTPTTNGQSWIGFGNSNVPSASANNFEFPMGVGNNSWTSTESQRQQGLPQLGLIGLFAQLGTAPGTGNSRTVTVRKNGASTALAVTISGSNTTGNTTGNVVFSSGDLISMMASISGTPAADTGGVAWGIGLYMLTSSLTKTAQYFVQTSHTLTKALRYDIKSAPSITKGLQYVVKTSPSITKGLRYEMKTVPAAFTKAAIYRVKTAPVITKGLQYEVVGTPSVTKSLQYRVIGSHTFTKDLAYEVVNNPSLTADLAYFVTTDTILQLAATYRIGQGVTLQKGLQYEVRTIPSITKTVQYMVKSSPKISLALQYNLGGQPAISKSEIYYIVVGHLLTKALRYVVDATISAITLGLQYVVTPSSTDYIPQLFGGQHFGAYVYESGGRVTPMTSITKPARYYIASQRILAKTLQYKVQPVHAITKGLTYVAGSHPALQKSLTYYIDIHHPIIKSLQYNIAQPFLYYVPLRLEVETTPAADTLETTSSIVTAQTNATLEDIDTNGTNATITSNS